MIYKIYIIIKYNIVIYIYYFIKACDDMNVSKKRAKNNMLK